MEIDGEMVEPAFSCSIDETEPDAPNVSKVAGKFLMGYEDVPLARAVIDARESLTIGLFPAIVRQIITKYLSFLAYSCEHPARRKRLAMDVDGMVKTWVPLIKKLALAHDIDEKDAASAALDDHLLPVIAAPVTQIREFYRKLTARLKEDREVPLFLYRLFEFWGENVLDKIESDKILTLKKEIAGRIAERSIQEIPREDWINSMIGALQWRDAEKLETIEKNLAAGEKPRVKGRESCLFLEVGEAEVML